MFASPYVDAVWFLGQVLFGAAIMVMLRRRLVQDFPAFFAYLIYHTALGITLVVLYRIGGDADYRYGYWLSQAVSAALGFAVIHELYANVFRQYEALQRLGLVMFRWALAVLLLVAVVAAASAPGSDASRLNSAVTTLERSVRLMQCGLLMFLFAFASYFRLSLRHYVFGLALGFGLFTSVELVAVTLRVHFGPAAYNMWNLVNMTAYSCAELIWVAYLVSPERVVVRANLPPASEVELWNQELLRLLHQ